MIIECPECGVKNSIEKPLQPGRRYRCGKCGASITFLQTVDTQGETSENTSGQGSLAVIPDEIKGWNWGAFLLSWIWGISNGVWISLVTLVPYVGIIMIFILGAKGNEWAWRNRKWESIEDFKRTQGKWTKWGAILFLAPFALFIWLSALSSC